MSCVSAYDLVAKEGGETEKPPFSELPHACSLAPTPSVVATITSVWQRDFPVSHLSPLQNLWVFLVGRGV